MELPAKVLVYSQLLNLNATSGMLMAVRPEGFYELRLTSQGKLHTVLAPVAATAIVFAEPEPEVMPEDLIER
ncbi:MAG: hypothetical protein ACUVRY_07600 [Thermoanaerobaculaceae bacterium]